jgi:hypothetical protein
VVLYEIYSKKSKVTNTYVHELYTINKWTTVIILDAYEADIGLSIDDSRREYDDTRLRLLLNIRAVVAVIVW